MASLDGDLGVRFLGVVLLRRRRRALSSTADESLGAACDSFGVVTATVFAASMIGGA